MTQTVEIQNLKCGGCEKTIKNKLESLKDVSDVSVNVENSTVSFSQKTDEAFIIVEKALAKLGYPLVTEENNLGRIAKSYISCALGRMNK